MVQPRGETAPDDIGGDVMSPLPHALGHALYRQLGMRQP